MLLGLAHREIRCEQEALAKLGAGEQQGWFAGSAQFTRKVSKLSSWPPTPPPAALAKLDTIAGNLSGLSQKSGAAPGCRARCPTALLP